MAREEDLKKVELNVSVNCCDGCKKKVLKALSIKGVLKIEIHPSLPKVTIVGNVSEEVLVKRLVKWGKVAEVVSPPPAAEARKVPPLQKQPPHEQQQGPGDTKKSETKNKEGDCERKVTCEIEQKKPSQNECGGKVEKTENCRQNSSTDECMKNTKSPSTNVASAPTATVSAMIASPLPHVNCFVSPAGVTQETMLLQQSNPYPYPYPYLYPCVPSSQAGFANPYVAPAAYWVTPSTIQVPVTQPYGARDCWGAPPRLTEYFNDDNTAGCFVM